MLRPKLSESREGSAHGVTAATTIAIGLLLLVTATYVGQRLLIARLLADVLGGASLGVLAGIVALQLARIAVIVVRACPR